MHEQLGIMLNDLHREQPNPLHHRLQDQWQILRQTLRPFGIHHGQRAQDRNNGPSHQQISIANGIFVQEGISIRPDYVDAVQSTYKSNFRTMDFMKNSKISTASINE